MYAFYATTETNARSIAINGRLTNGLVTRLLFCFLFRGTLVMGDARRVEDGLVIGLEDYTTVSVGESARVLRTLLSRIIVTVRCFLCNGTFLLNASDGECAVLITATSRGGILLFGTGVTCMSVN